MSARLVQQVIASTTMTVLVSDDYPLVEHARTALENYRAAVEKMTPEQKAKSLRAEINNGRLAQLAIFAFLCEAKVPGSVPALTGIIGPSDANSIAMIPL